MNMACVQGTAVNLFDEYCLLIPPKLKSCQDGPPGRRVMFITDQKENFNIVVPQIVRTAQKEPLWNNIKL